MPVAPSRPFTFAQLEQLWINNGGDRASASLMAAIALAESSGNPASINPHDNNGRQTSWGLWQISDGTHSMPVANILDPNINARQAVAKKKSQGLSAWGTYTSGAYRTYMSNAAPDPNIPTGSTSTTTGTGSVQGASLSGDIGGAIGKGMADAFTALLQPLIATFLWGSEILLGVALMAGGIIVLVMNSEAGKSLASGAESAAVDFAAPEAAPIMQERRELVKKSRDRQNANSDTSNS